VLVLQGLDKSFDYKKILKAFKKGEPEAILGAQADALQCADVVAHFTSSVDCYLCA
jgi:hypothetical protein